MSLMILIADSGSTKTDWVCVNRETGEQIRFSTQGYNPNYLSSEQIAEDLRSSLPKNLDRAAVEEIHFYGSGVTEAQRAPMAQTLREVFPDAREVEAQSDTLGCCRALLQHSEGFAAILGTGTNTVIYDGEKMTLNIKGGGFILGDEGSGADLGKRLIIDFIRHRMPQRVYELCEKEINMDYSEIVRHIYKEPLPNRFCAQFAKFIQDHYDFDPYFDNLTTEAFRDFFRNLVTLYPDYTKYSFNAVGSVAYHHRSILERVVAEFGMPLGTILKAPLDALIDYHL